MSDRKAPSLMFAKICTFQSKPEKTKTKKKEEKQQTTKFKIALLHVHLDFFASSACTIFSISAANKEGHVFEGEPYKSQYEQLHNGNLIAKSDTSAFVLLSLGYTIINKLIEPSCHVVIINLGNHAHIIVANVVATSWKRVIMMDEQETKPEKKAKACETVKRESTFF